MVWLGQLEQTRGGGGGHNYVEQSGSSVGQNESQQRRGFRHWTSCDNLPLPGLAHIHRMQYGQEASETARGAEDSSVPPKQFFSASAKSKAAAVAMSLAKAPAEYQSFGKIPKIL